MSQGECEQTKNAKKKVGVWFAVGVEFGSRRWLVAGDVGVRGVEYRDFVMLNVHKGILQNKAYRKNLGWGYLNPKQSQDILKK